MTKNFIQLAVLTLALVLAQGIVFNHICLFNVAVPVVFVYALFKLPITLSVNWVLTFGFLLGLTVDMFSDTYGMNALACTITAMLRRPVLRLYMPRGDEPADPIPSIRSIGQSVYLKYLLTMTLIYCILIFTIETFTFFNFWRLILRIIFSTILSLAVMLGVDCLFSSGREKRL
nr:rod shape-determining protein MreD [Bacteroides sp.]